MKCYYYGEVINLSLKDKKMLKKFPVIKCKNRFWGLCKIYTISIPEKDIDATVKAFQENMSTALKKEWYITFHTPENVIVVFRKKFSLYRERESPLYLKNVLILLVRKIKKSGMKWYDMQGLWGFQRNSVIFCRKILKYNSTKNYSLKDNLRLTNTCAFVIREFPDGLEIIGE